MTDFLNKVIAIIIVAVMLLIAPLNLININNRTSAKLEALNIANNFLDKVTDKGYITSNDLDDLHREFATTGMYLEVDIEDYRPLVNGDNYVLTKLYNIDYDRIEHDSGKTNIKVGDVIRIHFYEDIESQESILWKNIVGIPDIYDEYLSVMRR